MPAAAATLLLYMRAAFSIRSRLICFCGLFFFNREPRVRPCLAGIPRGSLGSLDDSGSYLYRLAVAPVRPGFHDAIVKELHKVALAVFNQYAHFAITRPYATCPPVIQGARAEPQIPGRLVGIKNPIPLDPSFIAHSVQLNRTHPATNTKAEARSTTPTTIKQAISPFRLISEP